MIADEIRIKADNLVDGKHVEVFYVRAGLLMIQRYVPGRICLER